MDIEQNLRQLLVLQGDPGARFTDSVMARVGDVPLLPQPADSVVQLLDARVRRRSRRILFATVVVVVAAAATLTAVMRRDAVELPVPQAAKVQPADASLTPAGQDAAPQPLQPARFASAAAPLECFDEDVVQGLILQGAVRQTYNLSGKLPAELRGFEAPKTLALLGITEMTPRGSLAQTSVSVVYRSSLAPEAARAAGARALMAGGWQLRSDNRFAFSNVFDLTQNAESYCRDDLPVSIAANALRGVTYVVLSVSRSPPNSGMTNICQQPPQIARPPSELDRYMPTLALPNDPATREPVVRLGGGSSNGEVKRRANASFVTRDSIGNVAQHFARQMTAQGWSGVSTWNGTATAGSTWTRKAESDAEVQGTLVLTAFEEDRITVVFNIALSK